jgi:hypothetical protein
MARSQLHKIRVQGVSSDGRMQPKLNPTVANPLVDQTSTNNVADTYIFAANSFATPAGTEPLVYSIAPQAGFSINSGTRTISWTKPTGVYYVTVYATNNTGRWVADDFKITVT